LVATQKGIEQGILNETAIAKANAEAAVIIALADADREALRQAVLAFSNEVVDGQYIVTADAVQAYVQLKYYEAWDGSVPQTILDAVLSTLAVTDPSETP